jgi:hypothetical protein
MVAPVKTVARSVAGASALAALVLAAAGCPDTTTTASGFLVTGIQIRSAELVAGHGCGTGPGQVYRYAAVVTYAGTPLDTDASSPEAGTSGDAGTCGPSPSWVNTFECFNDGVFDNLPASDSGAQQFAVAIYAYDKAGYDGSGLPASLQCLSNACSAQDLCTVLAAAPKAQFTTTCAATQQQGIPVLAVCAPLQPVNGGTVAADAGADTGAGAGADAGADTGAGAGADASAGADAAPGADAGPGADATTGADAGTGADASASLDGASDGPAAD